MSWLEGKVVENRSWTDALFSLRVEGAALSFEAGQFVRIALDIAGEEFDFYPEDPTTFSDAIGAYIDLTETKGRVGLRQRIEQATASQ